MQSVKRGACPIVFLKRYFKEMEELNKKVDISPHKIFQKILDRQFYNL
jgi:ribonuclease I